MKPAKILMRGGVCQGAISCVCHETSSRNCPVHSTQDREHPAYRIHLPLDVIPDEILEAINKIEAWTKTNGWKNWIIKGVADANLYTQR